MGQKQQQNGINWCEVEVKIIEIDSVCYYTIEIATDFIRRNYIASCF